ncbi:MAG: hypothetical protein SGCHY_003383, partial [Lobulomycetales sp.]
MYAQFPTQSLVSMICSIVTITLALSATLTTAVPAPREGNAIQRYGSALAEETGDVVEGMLNTVVHPIQTIKNIGAFAGNLILHPVNTVEGMAMQVSDCFEDDVATCLGKATALGGSMFVGTKGFSRANKAAKDAAQAAKPAAGGRATAAEAASDAAPVAQTAEAASGAAAPVPKITRDAPGAASVAQTAEAAAKPGFLRRTGSSIKATAASAATSVKNTASNTVNAMKKGVTKPNAERAVIASGGAGLLSRQGENTRRYVAPRPFASSRGGFTR